MSAGSTRESVIPIGSNIPDYDCDRLHISCYCSTKRLVRHRNAQLSE